MIVLRRARERGHFNHGWLDTWHSFSFADYVDPRYMGFSVLRVINEDVIAPGAGFPTHPHRDMEIITYVLSGSLAHRDSMGNESVIQAGQIQKMSAGTGITHSEYNASDSEPVHLLQIWILPDRKGIAPGYQQVDMPVVRESGKLSRIASPGGGGAEVSVFQDISLYAGKFSGGESAAYAIAPGRQVYLHLARGEIDLNGESLEGGDGAMIEDERLLTLTGTAEAEVLLFDLP
jgi:redox-sensitive bicupin YhaK (pirin superfamily)